MPLPDISSFRLGVNLIWIWTCISNILGKLCESFKFIIENLKFINCRYLSLESGWSSNKLVIYTWTNIHSNSSSVPRDKKVFFRVVGLGPGGVRHHCHTFPSTNLQLQKVQTILSYYIACFMSDYVCSRHEKGNSKSWSFWFFSLKNSV